MRQVDLDLGVGPERLQDDVTALALRGFLFRQLARFDQALHQRLVLRELMRFAAANQVGPAVADLGEIEMVVQDAGGCRRRPHPADFGMCLRVRVNARVRDLDGFLEPVRESLRCHLILSIPRLHEVRVDRVGRHRARHLARGGAAHTIGDHE